MNVGDFYAEDSSSTWKLPLLYNYTYDQLNRLTKMDVFYGLNQNTNKWGDVDGVTSTRDYKERIAYDPNGNITKYLRNSNNNAGTEHAMDSLNYFYNTSTNQLNHIKDNAEDWIGGGKDLLDQSSNNYGYDPSGNMTKDLSQTIPDGGISWNAYGKILKVYHSSTTDNNPVKQVTYGYDAGGNRISKRVVKTGTKTVNWTWYVRDASGNLLGTYVSNGDSTHALTDYDLSKQDQVIYGSSRIGVAGTAYGVKKDSYDEFYYSPWNGVHLWVYKGGDQYELTNHLGNVLVTVGDRKIGVPSAANSSLIDHWKADISSAADYYPFGMVMADRTYQNNYRYGFNGKEKDDDVKGNWNSYDYGERLYDPRVARFLSVDPLSGKYPWYSPYQFAGGKPIWKVDLDGAEEEDPAEAREDREELSRRMERVELSRLLQNPTPEDRERQIKENEQFSKESPEQQSARFRRLINTLNDYSRNGFNAAERIFGAAPQQSTFNFKDANRVIEAQRLGFTPAQALVRIKTPFGFAEQAFSKQAAEVFNKVREGATLYKIGTLSTSTAGEAQFWSTENPANYLDKPQEFAAKFGIPAENLKSGQIFIEAGKLRAGSNFVTRPAPGVGSNKGGTIETVVDPGSVKLESFSIIH